MSEHSAEKTDAGTVFVVDDDAGIRRSLTRLLRTFGIQVQTFASADEFLGQAVLAGPCCAVLDLQMPHMNGLELQAAIRQLDPTLPILFMTGHGNVPSCVQAMKAGAQEFLEKPVEEQLLLEAVGRSLQQHRRELVQQEEIRGVRARWETLTPREREVLCCVIAGMLNKQIASQLGAAEKTIKVHRGRVMEKMQAHSVAELVRMVQAASLPVPGKP